MRVWLFTILSVLLGTASVGAQLSGIMTALVPTVDVTLNHPPSLGLQVQRVAFAESRGECSDEFVDAVIEDFVANDVDVIERQRLEEILQEIDLSVSGYINSKDALSIGQILGANALIFINTQRCATKQDQSRKSTKTKKGTYTTYYSTTEMSFKSSLRIVDLKTGRIFTAKTVEANPSKTNTSNDGYPTYPSEFELHDEAIRTAQVQVHRMFFPWSEIKTLRYFKDKKCNLASAYQMLQIGDIDAAAEQSLANLEICKTTPKIKDKLLGKAYYNVGMSFFMQDKFDQALEYLNEAFRYRDGGRVQETIRECKKAKQEALGMRQYEERMEMVRAAPEGKSSFSGTDGGTKKTGAKKSIKERLEELAELHEQGLLSDEEYQAKKTQILAEL